MKGVNKTNEQLLKENEKLKSKIAVLEKSDTTHKQTEETLRESEKKYKSLFYGINGAVLVHPFGEAGFNNFIEINDIACKRYGYTRKEFLKLSAKDISAPVDVALRGKIKGRENLSKKGKLIFEAEHITKKGKKIPVEICSNIFKFKGRKVILSVIRDITERKQTEKLIKDNEEKYRLLATNTLDIIWTTDLEFNLTYINNAIFKFLGYTPEEFIGLNPTTFTTMEGLKTIQNAAEQLITKYKKGETSQIKFEVQQIRKDGTLIDVEIRSNLLEDNKGNLVGFQGRSVDITERKYTERIQEVQYHISNAVITTENLDELYKIIHQQLGTIIDTTNFYIANYNEVTDEIFVPYFISKKVNVNQPHKMRGNGVTNYIIKNAKSLFLTEELRRKLINERKIANYKWSSKALLGVPLRIGKKVVGCIVIRSSKEKSQYTENDLIILEFISNQVATAIARKQTEEALKASEEKHRKLIETTSEGFWLISSEKKTLDVNLSLCDMLGYSKKEMIGKTPFDFVNAENKKIFTKQIMSSKNTKQRTYEILLIKKNGENLPTLFNATTSYDNNGKLSGAFAFVTNITKQKNTEQELIASEQLSMAVIKDSPLGISVRDKYGTLLLYNDAWKNIWGFTDKQVEPYMFKRTKLEMGEKDMYLGKHKERIKEIYEKGGSYHIPEMRLKPGKNRKALWIMQRFYAIKDVNDRVERVVILTSDISEWKHSLIVQDVLYNITHQVNKTRNLNELFKVTHRELSRIIDTKNYFIALRDEDSNQIKVAYTRDDMAGNKSKVISEKTLSSYVMKTGKPLLATEKLLKEMIAKNEVNRVGPVCKIWLGVPLILGEETIGVIAVQSYTNPEQYTERDLEILSFVSYEIALAINNKQIDEQIKKNLKEKNTLLRELYHRTKNNMQVISSMLKLQARNVEHRSQEGHTDVDFMYDSFNDVINKIKAMSLVHQKLYQSQNLSRINLKDYISDLINLLMKSYGIRSEAISLNLELEDVYVLIDSAVPLGLVLNEMISNVFKHAFSDNEEDEISIRLYKDEEDIINIQLSDNGIGIPNDIDLEKVNTMGLRTVFDLVKFQLKGEVTYKIENGLKWHIKLKDNLHKERI